MKKSLFAIIFILALVSSCKTPQKVLYFQHTKNHVDIPTTNIQFLTYAPGDEVTIYVSSASTPQLAYQFNLGNTVGTTSITRGGTNISNSTPNSNLRYVVDENGNVDMPGLGRVKISGLTRAQAASMIQNILKERGLLNDAIVTINSYNQMITVLGEVRSPGRIPINKDNMTILEALGAAGDLTIQAKRSNILVLRQEGDRTVPYYLDIRSDQIMSSPVYNLKQNDVIYVQPNKVKIGQYTNNDNALRSYGTWISIASFLMSLGLFIWKL